MTETRASTVHTVNTASGRIGYTEQGSGPVALFVHGVLMNKHLWRHQLAGLADMRRGIALDLLAHGDTEIDPAQDVSVTANAAMITEFLDALGIDKVDLIGNDSGGGGVAQIFAAKNPGRVRSLTLTDCDTHDNWPPQAFLPFVEMAESGGLPDALAAMLADKAVYRSENALGPAYEDPDSVSDEDIETYLRPFVRTAQRTRDLERFVAAFDNRHTLAIEDDLKRLDASAYIIWGTDDIYFPVQWAHWLADTLPNATAPIILDRARLFFPEERAEQFNSLLRASLASATDNPPTDTTGRS
jgi:pimeloyl-ACP methyl ester carboxylesterase